MFLKSVYFWVLVRNVELEVLVRWLCVYYNLRVLVEGKGGMCYKDKFYFIFIFYYDC